MFAHIQPLLVLVLVICYVTLTYSKARAVLEQWATANGYRILHSELRPLFTGPFFWRNFTKQPVYYVRVRERDGRERAGWVRCCVRWSGGSGTAEVRWDETGPLFRDSGSNSSFRTNCLRNRTIKIGLALLIFGTGPLDIIVLLSKLGIGDPNPNPIGPGLLAGLSFPAGIICVIAGVLQVVSARRRQSNSRLRM
jgi:hypothetical protein